ncbi:MAG TPA: carboxypeptidase-like regulatory domain-containing protein [Bryobacteraceae bacterium]|nr:carboxypeptidase-like regulatory domain-containing protein [Bryobacteraceae bacterium]
MSFERLLRLRAAVVLAIALSIAFAPCALAQSAGTAGLSGTITDASGAAVPNVAVTLTNADTNQVRTTSTGSDGVYKFSLISPGNYKIHLSATGFKAAEVSGLNLNVTESPVLDRTLEVGQQTEQVTVEASAGVLQSASSTLGTTVGTKTVTDLPLANRNYTQIIGLSAGTSVGVNNAAQFGKGTLDIAVNGNTPGQNNFQMDGVAIQSMAGNGSANDGGIYVGIAIPNPDAIQEFKIQTSTYDATYGRNPGANVNVVTKSGTNSWHGTAFEFFRNAKLNANDFFYNRDTCRTQYAGESCPKQVLNQNQFGGVIGGPIKKDKLFIFGSYQGTRQRDGVGTPEGNPGSSNISLYPIIPAGDRTSAAFVSQLIAANCELPSFGPPGPNGVLPCSSTSVSPVALKMLQVKNADGSYYFPTHATFGDPISFNSPAPFSENQYLVNGDYLPNAKNSLAMRFFYSTDPRIINFNTPIGGALPGAPDPVQYSNANAVLKLTTLVTNSLVNEARGSFQRLFSQATDSLPAGWTPQNLGITPIVPSQTQGPALSFLINGFGAGGFLEPQFSPTNQFQIADQVSWSHGRHTVRAGFELEKTQWNLDFAGLERGWLFIGSFTNLLAANNPGNIIQCLFCVSSGPPAAGGIIHAYRETNMNSFVQDDWKLSSKLTLNLGVRWEYDGTFSEKFGNLTNTWISQLAPNSQVPTAPLGLPANYAGWVTAGNYLQHYPQPPNGVLVNTSGTGALQKRPPLGDFGPRLGFAYQAASKLVIRGGVGLFYDRIGADRFVHAVEQGNPYATTLDYTGSAAAPFTIQNPFPNLPLGQFVQRWANPATLTTSELSVPFIAQVSHVPLVRQYNLNFQYEFVPSWVLEVGYVGSSGINLLDYNHNVNTAGIASASNPINGLTTTTLQNVAFRVPYVGYAPAGLQATAYDGSSNYNSLQITVRKQLSHGLTLQGSYTWSKSMSDVLVDSANSNNAGNLAQQYGPTYYNRPQRFIINYSWLIPTSQLKGVANAVLGGWTVSGVTTIQDGVPFTFLDTGAGSAYGTNGNQTTAGFARAQICPGMTYANIATPGGIESRLGGYSGGPGYFNASAFCPAPAIMPDGVTVTTQAACPTCATLFGNSGVGILPGPGQFNFDATLSKQFNFTERYHLQFRAEFFNLLNHPQFNGISPGSGTGGTTSFLPQPLVAGGSTITQTSVNPRVIQLGLKFSF